MTIAQRLYVLITTAAVGLLLLAGLNLYQMSRVYESANFANVNTVPALVALDEAALDFARLRVRIYRHVLNTDTSKMAELEVQIKDAQAGFAKAMKDYEPTIADDKDRALFQADQASYAAYTAGIEPILEASRKLDNNKALELLSKNISLGEQVNSELSAHIKYNVDLGLKAAADAQSAKSSATWVSVVLGMLILAVVATLGLLIARGVVRSLAQAMAAATRISNGDLSGAIVAQGNDETAQLLRAMQLMQEALKNIISEMNLMSAEHDKGDIDVHIDVNKFNGAFKEMAAGTNNMVFGHIAVKKKAMACVKEFGLGNLDAPLEKFPGKKVFINETIEQLRGNLKDIVGEIRTIVALANKGDFSTKISLEGKAGFTKELSEQLNLLSDTVDTAFKDTIHVAQALAQGDLTQVVTRDYQGAFNEVKQNLNGTVENLKTLVGQIQDATDTINTASKEIAAGNSDLSQRTEEQASSLEETASSMEELTSTVKQNAENAKQANQLAIGASDVAGKGGAVVSQVVVTMDSINESSRKIVDIISVIDGIAFQTNILALNAAVEAARAGEQGRGFAVVAGEVRNLAQRSAAAAKEIKTLIGDSVDKVEGGSRLVAQAGQTMEEIVGSIRRVTDIMAEITAASVEQSSGIEQVNLAITQMDEVTQQNAALVEEAAAAAESLEEQAQSLSLSVGSFKVDGRGVAVGRSVTVSRSVVARPAAPQRKLAAPMRKSAAPAPRPASSDGDWEEF